MRAGVPPGSRWARGLVIATLLLGLGAGAAGAARADDLGPLRSLYLEAVEREDAIARGLARVDELRRRAPAVPGSRRDATLTAYRGALVTLRAKHAFWPQQKLRYLREGLATLDAVIAAHPGHAEARYLRLMSCYYLPGVLGRKWSVREDFAELAELLPRVRGEYDPQMYAAVTRFVLENGRLPPERRAPLEAALEAADD